MTFDTQSGPLIVAPRRRAATRWISRPSRRGRIEPPPGLAEALGVEPRGGLGRRLSGGGAGGRGRGARPDARHRGPRADRRRRRPAGRGNVGVAALADAGAALRRRRAASSRPGSGIPEDPATGSLHCILAPLFADKLGRRVVTFHQAYPGRGGDLECEHRGERVLLRGRAVTVLEGRLRLAP